MALSNAEETVDRIESEIEERTDGESVSTAVRYVRRAAGSGALAGASGSVSLLQGLRAIRRGDRGRGLVRLLLGALFVAVAVVQRRSAGSSDGDGTDVDRTDVADTSPDIEEVSTGIEDDAESGPDRHPGEEAAAVADTSPDIGDVDSATDDGHDTGVGAPASDREASGDEATDVVDTSPDIEDVGSGSGEEPDRDASDDDAASVADTSPDVEEAGAGADAGIETEESDRGGGDGATATADASPDGEEAEDAGEDTESAGEDVEERTYERLGEAAFDEHGREVPVPQRAFDLNVLSLGDEAFWGIGEADDVVVSGIYDSLGEGVRYVASSRIDEERMLQVPDTVTDHWDEVAGGGTAVAGGDGLVFAIAEDAGDERLLVVPAQWADDVPGLGGEEEEEEE